MSGRSDEIEITDTLLNGRTVVINMEGLNVDVAQRIIDFTSGSAYAPVSYTHLDVYKRQHHARYRHGTSQSGPGNGNRGQGQLQYPRHLKPLMPYQTGNHTQ